MVYSQTRGFSSPTLVGLVDTINIICSNEDIEIIDARSTCECIKVYTKPQIVDRGGVFELELTFDSTGINQHDIEEIIYILTGNMKYEFIRLVVTAKIK